MNEVAVYKFNGFIDNGNNDYEFGNIPVWSGNIILNSNGWFNGIVTLNVFNEKRETLIFGNLLKNKIINFMIVGENIVIGSTLIKTEKGYEGVPIIADYIVYDDDRDNYCINQSNNALVILEEDLNYTNSDIEEIKNKVAKILSEGIYTETYNSVLANNDESLVLLDQMYIQYKGNVKGLIKELSKYQ